MNVKTFVLGPLIVTQALWVAARAARLPEATGERTGQTGLGPEIRLLVLGDSSAAGVGVTRQSEALGGRLSDRLAQDYLVNWSVVARSGGTVRSTTRKLDRLPARSFDVVLVALGVNDAKNGVALSAWTEGYRGLLDLLFDKFEARHVCVSGLPPVRRFPVLPRPLNGVLGERVEVFDAQLRQIADERPRVTYLPLDFTLDVTKMASDGFHPGPLIYAEWADRAADVFKAALTVAQSTPR